MITLESIRYRSVAIDTLRIEPGITSVIGPNGSGKTTLLKLLAGIAVPDTGSILIDGVPPRNAEIGWVNEYPDRNYLLWNVEEEIASSLRFRHFPESVIRVRVNSCLEAVGLSPVRTRPVRNLSGGEKILVALAAALAIRPQVLVLDEYDSHLDAQRTERIERVIHEGNTPYVIRCTQDMESAARGDHLVFLGDGKVVASGTPKNVFSSLAATAFYPLSWRCRT
jgi:energy-coupling factor transport system ATP-binding protein